MLITLLLSAIILLCILCIIISKTKKDKYKFILVFFLVGGFFYLRLMEKLPRHLYFDSIVLGLSAFGILILHSSKLLKDFGFTKSSGNFIKILEIFLKLKTTIFGELDNTYREMLYLFPNAPQFYIWFSIWVIKIKKNIFYIFY